MQDVASPDVRTALVNLLSRRTRKADFFSRLASSLRRANASPDEIERALAELESERIVIVNQGYCADPHLEGTDLRIVALVEAREADQEDPVAQALSHADAIWRQWLGDYLATHTCS